MRWPLYRSIWNHSAPNTTISSLHSMLTYLCLPAVSALRWMWLVVHSAEGWCPGCTSTCQPGLPLTRTQWKSITWYWYLQGPCWTWKTAWRVYSIETSCPSKADHIASLWYQRVMVWMGSGMLPYPLNSCSLLTDCSNYITWVALISAASDWMPCVLQVQPKRIGHHILTFTSLSLALTHNCEPPVKTYRDTSHVLCCLCHESPQHLQYQSQLHTCPGSGPSSIGRYLVNRWDQMGGKQNGRIQMESLTLSSMMTSHWQSSEVTAGAIQPHEPWYCQPTYGWPP